MQPTVALVDRRSLLGVSSRRTAVAQRLGEAPCDPVPGVIRVWAPEHRPEDLWLAANPFLTLALVETFKRRGRYSVHAACAAQSGRGVLLAGPSGAGKSTAVVALARAGDAVVVR